MNLFDISAALTLNSEDYEKGLANSESSAKSFGTKLKSVMGTAGKAVGVAMTTVAAGAAAVTTEFTKGISETAAYGDEIDKASQKMGISAEAYQEWDFILQHSGTSMSAAQAALKTLSSAAAKGDDSFAALGLSLEDVQKMSKEELFAATIEGLQNIEDENERAALAQKLLGKGAIEMGALLNTSAEDTAKMKKQVHDLGGVMSDDAVKAAASYQDAVQDLGVATDSLKRGLMEEFLPSTTEVMNGLTMLFSGDTEGGLGAIKEGINSITTTLTEAIPEYLPVVVSIIEAIATAIVENLPMLMESVLGVVQSIAGYIIENIPLLLETLLIIAESIASSIATNLPVIIPAIVEAVVTVAQTLVEHLPELLTALLQMIEGLAKGIIDALPIIIKALPSIIIGVVNFLIGAIPQIIQTGITLLTALIGALPEIITEIVKALPQIIEGIIGAVMDNLPLIIQAGIDLFLSLITALPQIISTLVQAMPQIITGIVNGLTAGFGRIVEVGKNLIQGIWNGISNAAEWLKSKIKEWAGNILGGIKKFFGISSPSKVFRDQIGKNIALGLGDGIDDYAYIAVDAMDRLADDVLDAASIEPTLDFGVAGDGGIASAGSRYGGVTNNIYAPKMTPAEVFEETRMQMEIQEWLNV